MKQLLTMVRNIDLDRSNLREIRQRRTQWRTCFRLWLDHSLLRPLLYHLGTLLQHVKELEDALDVLHTWTEDHGSVFSGGYFRGRKTV